MLKSFDKAYVFIRENVQRVRVTKFEAGERKETYHLIGDNACTCKGFLRTNECKHRKMWDTDGNIAEGVPPAYAAEFLKGLFKTLGLGEYMPPEPAPLVVTGTKVALKGVRGFDKVVGYRSLGKGEICVEITLAK